MKIAPFLLAAGLLLTTAVEGAHADPIGNDTVTINGIACTALADDSTGTGVGETRCNFPAGFTVPVDNRGRVELKEADGSISDILWTHITATNPHFHYISDPTITLTGDLKDFHEGNFNTDLGSVAEKAGPIDVSAKFGLPAGSVVVTSDVVDRAPDRVPEPSTLSLLLLGFGLGGLAALRWWRNA